MMASPTLLPAATPVPRATPSSIGDLLRSRGASSVVYAGSENGLWAIASHGDAKRILVVPKGSRMLAFDPGPSARQVAVLLGAAESGAGTHELLILDNSGTVVKRFDTFGVSQATPLPGKGQGTDLVDWSPQGDRVLVAFRDGSMFDVPLADGSEPTELTIDAAGDEILQPAWSPTGEAIAFIAANQESRKRSLDLYDIGTKRIRTIVDSVNGRFVVEFVWMPDGVSLLFTEGGELEGAVSGIDLWRIGANGEDRQLVVSAGTVAPVARIATMRPSPDGRSVAYAVLVPGANGPIIDSVWIHDMVTGVGYRIPLPSVTTVEDLWWTDQGLVISVTAGGSSGVLPSTLALLQVRLDGSASALWAAPIGAVAAPVASPVSTRPAA
jgi:hypothetical protein